MDANFFPPEDVRRTLHAYSVKHAENRFNDKPKEEIALLRAMGESGINKCDSRSILFCCPDKIRPHFCFNKNELPWMNEANSTPSGCEKVNGIINNLGCLAFFPFC